MPDIPTPTKRVEQIDICRGIALIAMTLFHFGWDLEMFGFAERGFASQPAMVWFARLIASSFLFLVGFSLVLAHPGSIRWQSFFKRLILVGGAAGMITVATYFATPDIYIFFGILHHIALASLLGILFLRLYWGLILISAVFVLLTFLYGRSTLFDAPFWWWSGLNAFTPRSSDYVPIFPFFTAVLTGMAAAKIALEKGLVSSWATRSHQSNPAVLLKFIGRHSLIYYLAHQPIMIGILYIFYQLTG